MLKGKKSRDAKWEVYPGIRKKKYFTMLGKGEEAIAINWTRKEGGAQGPDRGMKVGREAVVSRSIRIHYLGRGQRLLGSNVVWGEKGVS